MTTAAVLSKIALLVCYLPSPARMTASKQTYYDLVDRLFTGYKREVRPSATFTSSTEVQLNLELLSINDLDEQNQVLVSTVILQVSYVDINLAWDSFNYSGLDHIVYPQEKVWLPDLVVENSVTGLSQLGYDDLPVYIESTGLLRWEPCEVLKTSCDMDITFYSFDTQKCTIIVSTWASTRQDIDIDMFSTSAGEIDMSRYSESSTWIVKSGTIRELEVLSDADVTRLAFDIEIQRRWTYYLINIILPVVTLSLTASLVFALPADAGEKMGMSLTVLLAYAVYLTIIAESMPKTSIQVSVIGIYLSLLLFATALAVVFSTFVLHFQHYPGHIPVGKRLRKCVVSARPYLGLHKLKKPSDTEGNSVAQTEKTENSNKNLSSFLNRRNNKVNVATIGTTPDHQKTATGFSTVLRYSDAITRTRSDVAGRGSDVGSPAVFCFHVCHSAEYHYLSQLLGSRQSLSLFSGFARLSAGSEHFVKFILTHTEDRHQVNKRVSPGLGLPNVCEILVNKLQNNEQTSKKQQQQQKTSSIFRYIQANIMKCRAKCGIKSSPGSASNTRWQCHVFVFHLS